MLVNNEDRSRGRRREYRDIDIEIEIETQNAKHKASWSAAHGGLLSQSDFSASPIVPPVHQ